MRVSIFRLNGYDLFCFLRNAKTKVVHLIVEFCFVLLVVNVIFQGNWLQPLGKYIRFSVFEEAQLVVRKFQNPRARGVVWPEENEEEKR